MKREILFRGKRIDNGDWIEGFYEVQKDRHFINYAIQGCYFDSSEVIEETVGQFTGLTDKNGVRIFEGDVISFEKHKGYLLESFVGVIDFDPRYGYFIPYRLNFADTDELQEDVLNYCTVIGNVHQNKDLLK